MGILLRVREHAGVLFILSGLCGLAYGPALFLPLISDSYQQVGMAREWGPMDAWPELARDALYRSRATSLVLTYWTEQFLGIAAPVLTGTMILLHAINSMLVYALCRKLGAAKLASVAAGGFFAVHEGHQEAVIWYAALPETLVFFFVLAGLLAWIEWLRRGGVWWYSLCLFLFVLALLSKESAVVGPALCLAAAWIEQRKLRGKIILALAPFAVLTAIYTLGIFAASAGHLHFNDGTFSLRAPFLLTLRNSTGRLLWPWGIIAVALLILIRRVATPWKLPAMLGVVAGWIVITLLPYSFLTYMPRTPSRHTYLASAALAALVGVAVVQLYVLKGRSWAASLMALAVLHNCGYLWTRKFDQYIERAEPTERLIREASKQPSVTVHCFPYGQTVAWYTLLVGAGKLPEQIRYIPHRDPRGLADLCFKRDAPGFNRDAAGSSNSGQ